MLLNIKFELQITFLKQGWHRIRTGSVQCSCSCHEPPLRVGLLCDVEKNKIFKFVSLFIPSWWWNFKLVLLTYILQNRSLHLLSVGKTIAFSARKEFCPETLPAEEEVETGIWDCTLISEYDSNHSAFFTMNLTTTLFLKLHFTLHQ